MACLRRSKCASWINPQTGYFLRGYYASRPERGATPCLSIPEQQSPLFRQMCQAHFPDFKERLVNTMDFVGIVEEFPESLCRMAGLIGYKTYRVPPRANQGEGRVSERPLAGGRFAPKLLGQDID